jgi:ABC-type multidrug transport system fused ATPase/permease subunit
MNTPYKSGRFGQFAAFTAYYLKFSGGKFYALQSLELVKLFTKNIGLVSILPLLSIAGFIKWTPPEGLLRDISELAHASGLASSLYVIVGLYLLITSFNAVISYFQGLLTVSLQQNFHMHIRSSLYGKLLRAEWNFLAIKDRGRLSHTYLADLGKVQLSGRLIVDLLKSLVAASIISIFAAIISWKLTLVALGAASIGVALQIVFTKQMHRNAEDNRNNAREIFGQMMESLSGLKLVKAYASEEAHLNKFKDQSAESSRLIVAQHQQTAVQNLIKGILLSTFVAVFIVLALPYLQGDGLLLGLFFIILSKINGGVQGMISASRKIIVNLPSFDAYQSFLTELEAHKESAPVQDPIRLREGIELKNVSFAYNPTERTTLKSVNLHIPARQTTAIQGPSGAGKTTLMDLLLGLLKPEIGEILIDDKPLEGAMRGSWRRSIAYIPQEPFLFNESIRDNLLYFAPEASEAEIWRCLAAANAAHFVRKLKDGLDTQVGDRGTRLSGGERQRLTLARALMRRPQVIFLDEATNQLDRATEFKVQESIEQLHGELTIVIISHRQENLEIADHVFHIERGSVSKVR